MEVNFKALAQMYREEGWGSETAIRHALIKMRSERTRELIELAVPGGDKERALWLTMELALIEAYSANFR